jgi:hypothetical protein
LRIENVRRSNRFPDVRNGLGQKRNHHGSTPIVAHEFAGKRFAPMSQPLVVSIPHRLGRQEATRRIKTGLGNARTNYAPWLAIEEETWSGDALQFRVRAVGQTAGGKIEVFDDHVQLEVTLPWLLGKFAEKLAPAIRKEGVLMLEKK